MPQAKAKAATDTTSTAQGRFTVQLPADVRPMLDALGREAISGVKAAMGIDIELSMAQVVTGIIKAQHEVMTAKQAAEAEAVATAQAESNGAEAAGATDGE